MASRGGARAEGSDGSDFRHREKVATHYQISSTYKVRMKFAIFLHFLLFLFMFAKISSELLEKAGVSINELYGINFPKPMLWEWIWLISTVFAVSSYFGIRKNKVATMKISAWGIFCFGIFPIIAAALHYLDDLLTYMQSGSDKHHIKMFRGIPVAAVWYGFIGIAFQVHVLSIVFALKLVEAWSPRAAAKKTN